MIFIYGAPQEGINIKNQRERLVRPLVFMLAESNDSGMHSQLAANTLSSQAA